LTGAAISAGVSLFGTAQKTRATPATLGFYPATDIYGPGTFHLDVDSYRVNDFAGDGFDTVGLTSGIGDGDGILGRSEVGFDYVTSGLASNHSGDRIYQNGKTQIYNNDKAGIRVVGGLWLFGSKTSGAPNIGYLLGSKSFTFGRIQAGVAHAFRAQPAGSGDTFLQLGFDRVITGKILFAADFYSGKGAFSGVQPTLYYAVNDKASFGIGYFFNNEPVGGADNDQLYLCFDYNFGGRAPAPPDKAPPDKAPPGA
jgi:hypothetical protein